MGEFLIAAAYTVLGFSLLAAWVWFLDRLQRRRPPARDTEQG